MHSCGNKSDREREMEGIRGEEKRGQWLNLRNMASSLINIFCASAGGSDF